MRCYAEWSAVAASGYPSPQAGPAAPQAFSGPGKMTCNAPASDGASTTSCDVLVFLAQIKEKLWCEVRPIRPLDRSGLGIDYNLPEQIHIPKWLKHLAVELTGEIYVFDLPVAERETKLVAASVLNALDMKKHGPTPSHDNGGMGSSGRRSRARFQFALSSSRCSSIHSKSSRSARCDMVPVTIPLSISTITSWS